MRGILVEPACRRRLGSEPAAEEGGLRPLDSQRFIGAFKRLNESACELSPRNRRVPAPDSTAAADAKSPPDRGTPQSEGLSSAGGIRFG